MERHLLRMTNLIHRRPAKKLGNFDNGTFDDWTVSGTAFGDVPVTGNLPGQLPVDGWVGSGFVNSFHNYDGSTGTLTSSNFTIDKDYINFLIGGGNHPYVQGSAVNGAIPTENVFADFEGNTYGDGWKATGDFSGTEPVAGTLPGQQTVGSYLGNKLVNTFLMEIRQPEPLPHLRSQSPNHI
ncbi:hypothetical protein GCM10020331_007040 [Ectobacillus funiculus]